MLMKDEVQKYFSICERDRRSGDELQSRKDALHFLVVVASLLPNLNNNNQKLLETSKENAVTVQYSTPVLFMPDCTVVNEGLIF